MPGGRQLLQVAGAAAVAAIVALTLPRAAAADAALLWPAGSGVTAPAGVTTTPTGDVWVADDIRGVCRMQPGAGGGVVESPYCGAAEGVHAGPVKATGLAFDAVSSSFYASDGASSGGAIWQLHYDAASRTIDGATRLVSLPADRVMAMALGAPPLAGAVPDLFFVTKESGAVMRVDLSPGALTQPTTVGFAQSAHASGIAHLDGAIYLAEATGVTRLVLGAPGNGIAAAVPALAGAGASALAVDRAAHRLYVGTSEPDLRDHVAVLDTAEGSAEPYEAGFAGVTALAVQPDGAVLVGDDPRAASGAIDSQGQGRIWRVGWQPLHRPAVRITSGPPAVGAAIRTVFGYSSRADAWFQCRLATTTWATCPGKGAGSTEYDGLAEGLHRFSVRAVATDQGVPATRTFVIDRTAPRVRVTTPSGRLVAGAAAPAMNISADEDYVVFSCSVDGRPFAPCQPGDPMPGLAAGTHWLRVMAVDLAGNVSDAQDSSAAVSFRMVEPPKPPPPPPPPPPKPDPPIVVEPPPALRPLRLTPTRIARPSAARRAKPLRMTLDAPPNATSARIVVLGHNRTVLTRTVRLRPGVVNRIAVALSATERRRLRRGRYLVSAVLGGARGAVGSAQAEELRVTRRG